jgi:hypothetical protein
MPGDRSDPSGAAGAFGAGREEQEDRSFIHIELLFNDTSFEFISKEKIPEQYTRDPVPEQYLMVSGKEQNRVPPKQDLSRKLSDRKPNRRR